MRTKQYRLQRSNYHGVYESRSCFGRKRGISWGRWLTIKTFSNPAEAIEEANTKRGPDRWRVVYGKEIVWNMPNR